MLDVSYLLFAADVYAYFYYTLLESGVSIILPLLLAIPGPPLKDTLGSSRFNLAHQGLAREASDAWAGSASKIYSSVGIARSGPRNDPEQGPRRDQ